MSAYQKQSQQYVNTICLLMWYIQCCISYKWTFKQPKPMNQKSLRSQNQIWDQPSLFRCRMFKFNLLEPMVSFVPEPKMSLFNPEPVAHWEVQLQKPTTSHTTCKLNWSWMNFVYWIHYNKQCSVECLLRYNCYNTARQEQLYFKLCCTTH